MFRFARLFSSSVPPAASPTPSWASLGVPHHLLGKLARVLRGAGSSPSPTPVQAASLPYLLADLARPPGDCVLHSETGSGKTLAYLLPLFARLDARDAPAARLRGIVVTPTRELSHQVAGVAEQLAAVGSKKDPSRAVRVLRVAGEVTAQLLHELKARPPHVLVGTPSTLARLVGAHVNTGELQALVLDEADELLRNHSVAAVRALVAGVKRHSNRPGVIAVSATSSFGLEQFASESLSGQRLVVDLTRNGAGALPSSIAHYFVRVPRPNASYNTFTRFLAAAKPTCALSFHNSQRSMDALEVHLRECKVPAGVLGNILANAQRARSLEGARSGRLRVLLSTEMAARGLDLPRVSHVLNFDLPTSFREYVHRAGRTGRMSSLAGGRTGSVVTFVGSEKDKEAIAGNVRQLGTELTEIVLEGGAIISSQNSLLSLQSRNHAELSA